LTGIDHFYDNILNAKEVTGGPLVKALKTLAVIRREKGYSRNLTESVMPILEIVSENAGEDFDDCTNHQDVAEFLNVLFNLLDQELSSSPSTATDIDFLFGSKALEYRHCRR
jgi:ubiquitin C-terminal hydrolase